MADWLIIRLPRTTTPAGQGSTHWPVQWLGADAHGQPLGATESGTLADAAGHAAGRRLAVLVPGTEVLQTLVTLPPNAATNRLQQIVPYALEEQLAGDVEAQHVVAGTRHGEHQVAAASVERERMRAWIAALSEAGLQPELLCADSALLPENPGNTVVWFEGESLYVRPAGSPAPALLLPAGDAAAMLALACAQPLGELHVILYITPLDWQRHSAGFEALRPQLGTLNVQLLNSGPLPWLASLLPGRAAASGSGCLNLLQGEFAARRSWGTHWQQWRVAALLLGALLLVHGIGSAWHVRQLARSDAAFDTAIKDFAARAMPGDSGTGAVRSRAEKKLLAAQSGGGDGLLQTLAALAAAMRGIDGASVQSLSYQGSALELKLRTPDADSLEKISQALQSQGVAAQLAAGGGQAGAYEGRLQLQLKGRS